MSQETREQHEAQVARYLREGRTVSGGKDNPPDRYVAVALVGPIDSILNAINTYADQGYRIACAVSDYVLMGNYKENK